MPFIRNLRASEISYTPDIPRIILSELIVGYVRGISASFAYNTEGLSYESRLREFLNTCKYLDPCNFRLWV